MSRSKKKKKIRSHVKRVKLQQQKHPMSPSKYKRKLREARRKDFFRVFWWIIFALIMLVIAVFVAANYYMYQKTGETVFSCYESAKEIVAESSPDDFKLAQTSYIYADDGTVLTTLSEADDATYLVYDEIPGYVVQSFVAIEDRSFWENNGIDLKGMARVTINFVKTRGEVAEGASTITQQLARGVYLSHEKTMLRKIKEIFIARELTKKYTKQEIMEFYCNTCCFANGIYGVEDASQKYFHCSVKDLSLSQIAYICSIPNRPEYYNPLKEPQNAIKRRDKILSDMCECGYISESSMKEAQAEQITINELEEKKEFYNYEVTYAIYCACRFFMEQDGFDFRYTYESDEDYNQYQALYDEAYAQAKHKLYTGGYKVYTTMNLQTQAALQEILDENLSFSEELQDNGIYKLQGAMTVIDNETGKVVAMIGGRSQEAINSTYSLNRGYQGFAQPGSSFKPLVVYTPALNEGYTATSILKNINVKEARESNSAEIGEMSGEEMTLRSAVENSVNGCAYWLFNLITPRIGLSYVTDMHFSKIIPGDYTLSAALGGLTYGVSTAEMANAYSTLENHGEYRQADCILTITEADGDVVYSDPEAVSIYGRDAADAMTDIMRGVVTDGTAKAMKWYSSTGTEAAGKTGTTNDNKAGWFCGYTPYYTIAVWVGCDTPTPVSNLQGATYPAYIWKEAMLYMINGKTTKAFDLNATYSYETIEEMQDEEEILDEILDEEAINNIQDQMNQDAEGNASDNNAGTSGQDDGSGSSSANNGDAGEREYENTDTISGGTIE